MVPLDLVKCRLQVDPVKYKNIGNGFSVTVKEGGMRALGLGWAPTFFGYSAQGLCKFGFYEVFKTMYADLIGEVSGSNICEKRCMVSFANMRNL